METMLTKNEESPSKLIALALERQADPGTLEKLMDLQERWEEREARKAYVVAMSAFKQQAPAVLRKNDVVDFTTQKGRTSYNYANLGSIVQEITAILGKHQLSASWSTDQNGNNVTVTCHVTHIAGHRESVTLTGPIDESGNKNRIQAVGSTVTYLQRYTLLAALGLATGEDDDGRQGAKPGKPKTQMQEPQGKQPEPPPANDETCTKIVDVLMRTGKNSKGKDYTIYTIKSETGIDYTTFSESFAAIAKTAKKQGAFVLMTFTTDKFGKKIETIEPYEETPATEERQPGEGDE